MHHRFLLFALALALAPACIEPQDGVVQSLIGEGSGGPELPNGDTGTQVCKTVTVTGKLFYNDLRWQGRFGLRKTPTNVDGTRDGFTADLSNDNKNYLGLLDAQVDVYEVDNTSPYLTDPDCSSVEYRGTTSVAADGSWAWTGTVCDACNVDSEGSNDEDLSIAAKVSLRKCDHPDARCFSLRDPTGTPTTNHYDDNWDGPVWSQWIRSATVAAPKVLHSGNTVPTGTDYFQASSTQSAGLATDAKAQAASAFATLVDVTRKVHLEENVPFDHARWGEIKAYFPDVLGGSHSHQASRLCIEGPDGDSAPQTFDRWVDSYHVAHEYGHLVHYWQWEGTGKYVDYCYNETRPLYPALCGESDPQGEYAINAFKEGWANFIRDITFEGTGSTEAHTCADSGYVVLGGRHFIDDVEHALCNLRTAPDDRPDPNIPFALVAQTYAVSLLELNDAVADMWWAEPRRTEVKNSTSFLPGASTPLGICELARQLAGADPTHVDDLETRLALNSIDCNL